MVYKKYRHEVQTLWYLQNSRLRHNLFFVNSQIVNRPLSFCSVYCVPGTLNKENKQVVSENVTSTSHLENQLNSVQFAKFFKCYFTKCDQTLQIRFILVDTVEKF